MHRSVILSALVLASLQPTTAEARTRYVLVSPSELRGAMQVVDARNSPQPAPWPMATHVPFDRVVTTRDGIPNQLRPAEQLLRLFSHLDPIVPTLVVGSGQSPDSFMEVAR